MVNKHINLGENLGVDDVGTVLEKFGKFQIIQYALVCLPVIFISMTNVNFIFVAGEVGYRCDIQECDRTNSTPPRPFWWSNDTADECHRPVLDRQKYEEHNGTCSAETFTNKTEECTHWVYESQDSIVAEMNLACQSWKPVLVGVMHNTGMLVSMVFVGWLADRFGRKPCLIVCSVGSCIGLVKSFLSSYYWFIAIEFLESVIGAGMYTVGGVILIEITGQNKRILCGLVFSYAIYTGEAIFACIAIAVPYWRTLVQIVYTPTVLFLLYTWILYESPRWQILVGKSMDAKKTICSVIRHNNFNIAPESVMDMNDEEFCKKFILASENKNSDGFRKIWKSVQIRKRLVVLSYATFSVGFVYYGLLINSVLLPGDKYTNFIISALMSFPGELMSYFFMSRYGRKYSLMSGFTICGLLCIGLAFVPESLPWLKVLFFVLGKLMVAMCYTGVYTYIMEMFPTSTRGTVVGICSFFAKIGSLVSPATPLLNLVMPEILPLLFGALMILAGGLLILTPETKGVPLADTIEQVEAQIEKK